MPPLISIIIATFNCRQKLPRCLKSIQEQTCRDFELVVMDGGSTDGTVDLLCEAGPQIAYWNSEPDHGVYHAWNKALKQVRGEWVCFLGADDRLAERDVFEKIQPVLQAQKSEVALVYGRLAVVNLAGEIVEYLGQPWPEVRERYRQVHCIPHSGAFQHRSVFAAGGFDESFRIAGDYDLLLRELLHREALFVPEVTVNLMEIGGMSSNPRNSLINLRENRRAQRKWLGRSGLFPGPIWLAAYVRVWIRLALVALFGEQRVAGLLDLGRRLMGKTAYWQKV